MDNNNCHTVNENFDIEKLFDRKASSFKALGRRMDAFSDDEIYSMLCLAFEEAVKNNTLICDNAGWHFDTDFASITLVPNLDASSPYDKYLSFTFKETEYNQWLEQNILSDDSSAPPVPTTLNDVILVPNDLIRLNRFVTGEDELPSEVIIEILENSYANAVKNNALIPYGKHRYNFFIGLKTEQGNDIVGGIKLIKNCNGQKQWMLNYIGYRENLNSNGLTDAFEDFAYIRNTTYLQDLADLARSEEWTFRGSSDDYEILRNYIAYTFFKLQLEGKICTNKEGTFSAFNTGLPSGDYEAIYMCFTKSQSQEKWQYAGVCTAANGYLGKQLVSNFTLLPQQAQYIKSKDNIVYDKNRKLFVDTDHIILERLHRIPLGFLEKHLYFVPESTDIIRRIRNAEDSQTYWSLYTDLQSLIDGSFTAKEHLKTALNSVVDKALRVVHWNYRLAVPSYFPKGDDMSLLLPMDFLDSGSPQAALVVQLTKSGNYIGHTILSMKQAYINARLIGSQESSWLTV